MTTISITACCSHHDPRLIIPQPRRCLINTLEDALLERVFNELQFHQRCLPLPAPSPAPPPPRPARLCVHHLDQGSLPSPLPCCFVSVLSCEPCDQRECSALTSHGASAVRLAASPRVCRRWSKILSRPMSAAWQHAHIDLQRVHKRSCADWRPTGPDSWRPGWLRRGSAGVHETLRYAWSSADPPCCQHPSCLSHRQLRLFPQAPQLRAPYDPHGQNQL